MPRVLMGGFEGNLKNLLKSKLGDYPISRVAGAAEIQEELAGGSVSLLILDHNLDDSPGIQVLERIRANPQWTELPVIYCVRNGPVSEVTRKLVNDLDVRAVLLPPLDPNELARQAAHILGISQASFAEGADPQIERALTEARGRFLAGIQERLETLERAGVALLEKRLKPDLREAAQREAHKLAGLLGTLGFGAGSRFARQIEEILEEGSAAGSAQAIRYSELVAALRLDVEKPQDQVAGPAEQSDREGQISLLIVDHDEEFAERLEAEALGRGILVRRAKDFAEAARLISVRAPDVALADLLASGKEEEGLDFLESLARHAPPVPAVVLTSKDSLTDRVEVARRCGRGFLPRAFSAPQILDAVLMLVDRLHAGDTRIMAVDDDPEVLSLLFSLLEPHSISMKTVVDPLQFWESFETFAPDLLVLDVDMPRLGGIELCRVVRNDARWAETPIIFLTQHNDPETIQRVFSSGADDFVSKPIVGPELLTRIFNRLERLRMRRRISETDLLTGALNRRKASQMMADFLELSQKHEQPFSLAVLEVEDLKTINQEHGQVAGDIALERSAHLLQEAFRSEDVFARWGGGEFVVGMYGLTRYDGVGRLTELLDRVHRETFKSAEGTGFRVKLSAGVAQFPEDGSNLEELYQSASAAQIQARTEGGGKAIPAGWTSGQRDGPKKVDVTLVIRDEAQASLLLHTLEARGYRTRWLQDGKAAEKLLAGSQPALHSKVIFIETDLPGMDGISLLKQLISDGALRDARVIMLTSPSVANEAQAVLELGAFDYVAKPFNPPVAAQHIRRALDVSSSANSSGHASLGESVNPRTLRAGLDAAASY